MQQRVIEVKNISKVYRMGQERIKALNDVSFTIHKGEYCCLLGTSGSGKSTLLNLMAGLEKPTKGQIKVGKWALHKMNEKQLALFRKNHIGFVFQSYNLMPTLTALENVSLPLIFHRVPKRLRDKKATDMLKAVGLGDRLLHKPSEMSGGQQQRVSIARAFISQPKVVFADEPTGNLDSKTTEEVMELMVSMARSNDQSLIVVTHDREVSAHADKVIYIHDGAIAKITNNNERERGM